MDISQVSAPRLLGAVEILNKLEKYPFGLTTKSACSFFFIMKQEFLQLPMKVVKNILADNINLAEHLASRRESIQKTLSKQPKNLLQAPSEDGTALREARTRALQQGRKGRGKMRGDRWQKTALERVAAGENLKENDNELIHPNPPQFPEDSTAVALQIVNGRTVEFKYGSPEASTAKVRPIDPEPARAGVIRYMLKYYDTPGATLIHPPPRDQDPSYIDEEGSSNRVLKDPLHGNVSERLYKPPPQNPESDHLLRFHPKVRELPMVHSREKEYIPRRHRLREGNFTALRHRRAEAQVYTPPVARIIPADAPGRWPTSPAKPGASARKPESPVKQPKVAESEEALQRFIARSGDLSTGGDQPAPADSGAHVKRSSSRSSDALASDAHTLVLKRVRGASLSTSESGEPAEAPQSTKAAKDLTRSVEVHMHSSLLDDHPKKRKRFVSLRNTVKGIVLAGKLRRFIAGAKRKSRVSKDRDEEQVTPALASIADAEDEAASSEPGEFEFESPTNRSPQPDVEASTSVMKADQFDVEMVGRDEADRGDVGMVGRDDADRDDVRMVGRDEATRLSRASREPRISSQSDAPAAAEKVDPDEGKPKRMPRRSQPAAIGRRAAEKPRRRDFREKRISMQLEREKRMGPPPAPCSEALAEFAQVSKQRLKADLQNLREFTGALKPEIFSLRAVSTIDPTPLTADTGTNEEPRGSCAMSSSRVLSSSVMSMSVADIFESREQEMIADEEDAESYAHAIGKVSDKALAMVIDDLLPQHKKGKRHLMDDDDAGLSLQQETMSATAGSPAAVDPSPEWMGKRFYKGREANSSYGYMFKSENDYFKARKSKLPTVEVSRLDIPSQLQNLGVNLGNPLVLHTESAREHSPPSTTESSELLTADRTMKKQSTRSERWIREEDALQIRTCLVAVAEASAGISPPHSQRRVTRGSTLYQSRGDPSSVPETSSELAESCEMSRASSPAASILGSRSVTPSASFWVASSPRAGARSMTPSWPPPPDQLFPGMLTPVPVEDSPDGFPEPWKHSISPSLASPKHPHRDSDREASSREAPATAPHAPRAPSGRKTATPSAGTFQLTMPSVNATPNPESASAPRGGAATGCADTAASSACSPYMYPVRAISAEPSSRGKPTAFRSVGATNERLHGRLPSDNSRSPALQGNMKGRTSRPALIHISKVERASSDTAAPPQEALSVNFIRVSPRKTSSPFEDKQELCQLRLAPQEGSAPANESTRIPSKDVRQLAGGSKRIAALSS
ncbi:hypothetical protein CYMTET_51385 [Cymbomonas tetramitiformis]|uniref:Uncharacterized protein n=1 Tax=Cymbomonas tetramitiformis TaxID=36881 RepID=A0AAE0BL62_9CHLO|nr:hypothetical protein CYMTET_51385 [Cymbomonas tetramitiformis]